MTAEDVLAQARAIWHLPWKIDPNADDPAVVTADTGGLTVVLAVTAPLTIVGTLPDDEPFYEAETDDLREALAELERTFRRLVDLPALAGR